MLPLSHVYVSTQASGRKTPLLIFGSILPDIATTSAQSIGRDKIHNAPRDFFNFVQTHYPDLIDLAWGVRLHSQVDGGADYYSDDSKAGYAKIEGAKISHAVAELLEIPKGDVSLVLAHNFIELAVDLQLHQDHPEVLTSYRAALEAIEPRIPEITECLADYLNLDSSLILSELRTLIYFLSPANFLSKDAAVQQVVLPLIKIKFHKSVAATEVLKIVDQAIVITKSTYGEFLSNSVIKVTRNIL